MGWEIDDFLPNPSLIIGSAKSAGMVSIYCVGLCGDIPVPGREGRHIIRDELPPKICL